MASGSCRSSSTQSTRPPRAAIASTSVWLRAIRAARQPFGELVLDQQRVAVVVLDEQQRDRAARDPRAIDEQLIIAARRRGEIEATVCGRVRELASVLRRCHDPQC